MRILINENQLKNIINEAIPYKIAKEYITRERKEGTLKLMNTIFNRLKDLPNAKVIDRRGHRISIPYTGSPLENRITDFLLKYDFKVLNYDENEAENIRKPGQIIKITSALSTIGNKMPIGNEYLDLYAAARSKDATKRLDKVVVFSKHPYDIAGMSYGRSWKSCTDLVIGPKRKFVKVDIENGTVIAYLATPDDTNLRQPLGRVLIKPYVDVKDEKNIILYPENNTYGKIEDPRTFIGFLDDILERVQDVTSEYNLLSCINQDSKRTKIKSRDVIKQNALDKLQTGGKMEDDEFDLLNYDQKNEYIEKRLKIIEEKKLLNGLDPYKYQYATKNQINRYNKLNVMSKFNHKLVLTETEIRLLPKENWKEYIDYSIDHYENPKSIFFQISVFILKNYELVMATESQLRKYFNLRINDFKLSEKMNMQTSRGTFPISYEFKYMPEDILDDFVNFEIEKINAGSELITPFSEYSQYLSQSQYDKIINAKK